jgi:hypothetical protein
MSIRSNIYSLLIFLIAFSCKDDPDPLPFGKEILEPSSRLVLVDTLSLDVSTVVLDSIQTSGQNLSLAGVYNDSRLGKIVAKSYFQVGFPARYTIDDEEYFDSISLIITYSGYSYGDTSQMQNLTVRRLSEKLKIKDQNSFYNTTSFDYEQNSLGELSFYARPSTKEKIAIPLDKTFGQEVFDYINQSQDDEFKDDEFNDFFKGLVLVPDEMNGNSIIGYVVQDTSLLVKIYTHTVETEQVTHEITLAVKNTNLQFNQISCDWSNNIVFENHSQRNDIPASETDNISFINAGLGMFTKLTFPTLPTLVEFENSVLIQALLYFKPAFGANMDLPEVTNFSIYKTGKNNTLDAMLVYNDGSAVRPKLNIDELYNEETWYSFDITDFLISELSDRYIDPGNALSISFSSTAAFNSVDQLLVGGTANKFTEPKLELLFLFYDLE